jgi:hypothetical protein
MEQLVDASVARVLRPRVVPSFEQLLPLGVGQQWEVGDPAVRVGDGGPEQDLKVPYHPVDRGGIEQIGVVLERTVQARLCPCHREFQVVLGCPTIDCDRGHLEAGQGHAHGRVVLERERRLGQRLPAGDPGRPQFFDQLLEGQLLMGIGPSCHGAHAPQQLAEGRVVRQVGAQHHDVEEAADHLVQLAPRPIGHRRAHRNIIPADVSLEQSLEAGQEGHEEPCRLATAQRLQRFGQGQGE